MSPIRVKFVAKMPPDEIDSLWRPLLPTGSDEVGECQFTFNPEATDYDFLVVYEDLPPLLRDKKINRRETLACAPQNTMLLTTEPSSIRIDGPHYLRQYGHVWTAKHPSLVRHDNQIRETPPLRFFYGRNMADGPHLPLTDSPPPKSKNLSAMSSTKAMAHTVHAKRLAFMLALRDRMAELDLYGRGILPVDDKAEAMADYRYHVAVENHVEPGHFTEKLTDCFVAGCLPFYFGDPDYARIFPADAVIPIDIEDIEGTIDVIRMAIVQDAYEARQSVLMKAREITLDRFNTLRAVANKVETLFDATAPRGGTIAGRHAFRRDHPIQALRDALFIRRARQSSFSSPLQRRSTD
ncbi:glycosyltransferase family 10 domain-containing protein [Algimonas porphyrae]|uniref:Fucosyltransferase C-terminal domain-containing protein n=1 Tax=Algimonas porphyrae TaxID=1128113 RepID=A0ABQ5V267_9PROT|nr:glycosyltransferase family 10 [Algimonas porphyrae]GLQ20332.1 hypothetical protein GCM10007854_12870 [Algimonas porphyrae]